MLSRSNANSECINTKKVVTGLAHRKKIERLRNWQMKLLQRQFYSPAKHPRRTIPAEIVTTKSCYFHRKAPPQMFFWALNMSLYLIWLTCQQTFFKVGNKDTETVSVSLMGTLNTVCLTYSFDDLLFKWYLYFTLDNSLFYSVFFDLTNKRNQKLINILENQKI